MSKHTPGPWAALDHPDGGVVEAIDGDFVRREVCHYFVDLDDNGESEANAQLIASAPDLLAVLERVSSCSRCGEDWGRCGDCDKAMSAAIAKARGGS